MNKENSTWMTLAGVLIACLLVPACDSPTQDHEDDHGAPIEGPPTSTTQERQMPPPAPPAQQAAAAPPTPAPAPPLPAPPAPDPALQQKLDEAQKQLDEANKKLAEAQAQSEAAKQDEAKKKAEDDAKLNKWREDMRNLATDLEHRIVYFKHHGTGLCYAYIWKEEGELVVPSDACCKKTDAQYATFRGGPALASVDCKIVENVLVNK